MPIYDAAMLYKEDGTPLVIIAGKEYGTGSSRDWAAKGTDLLGVRAVIAETYRAHPPLQPGRHGRAPAAVRARGAESLGLDGTETFTIIGVGEFKPRQEIAVKVTRGRRHRSSASPPAAASIPSTSSNISASGGILHYVLRNWLGGGLTARRASPSRSSAGPARC